MDDPMEGLDWGQIVITDDRKVDYNIWSDDPIVIYENEASLIGAYDDHTG